MDKKFVIVKHLNFSDRESYYSENGGNLDDGLYHGNLFKGKRYDSKEICDELIPSLFEIESERYDGFVEVCFSIKEIIVKI